MRSLLNITIDSNIETSLFGDMFDRVNYFDLGYKIGDILGRLTVDLYK